MLMKVVIIMPDFWIFTYIPVSFGEFLLWTHRETYIYQGFKHNPPPASIYFNQTQVLALEYKAVIIIIKKPQVGGGGCDSGCGTSRKIFWSFEY